MSTFGYLSTSSANITSLATFAQVQVINCLDVRPVHSLLNNSRSPPSFFSVPLAILPQSTALGPRFLSFAIVFVVCLFCSVFLRTSMTTVCSVSTCEWNVGRENGQDSKWGTGVSNILVLLDVGLILVALRVDLCRDKSRGLLTVHSPLGRFRERGFEFRVRPCTSFKEWGSGKRRFGVSVPCIISVSCIIR